MPEDEETVEQPQTKEHLIQEIREYLEDNQVTVGHHAALALADLIALEEAEARAHESSQFSNARNLLASVFEYLTKSFEVLDEKIPAVVDENFRRLVPYLLPYLDSASELEGFVIDMFSWVFEPIINDQTFPANTRQIAENFKRYLDFVLKNGKIERSAGVWMRTKSGGGTIEGPRWNTLWEPTQGYRVYSGWGSPTQLKLPKARSVEGLEKVIENFHASLAIYTTYSVIHRDVERSKFLVPGYWEAYQKIKVWFDTLRDIEYKRERESMIQINRLDEQYARDIGTFSALSILKSLGDDILAGSFAAPSQPEAKEEQEASVETETEKITSFEG